jgi:hypothetical protein
LIGNIQHSKLLYHGRPCNDTPVNDSASRPMDIPGEKQGRRLHLHSVVEDAQVSALQ